ncbi:MAG: tRNA1(Val) (adenine(37)-N6)-methyltransferase [Prolixibacteraceae bacterium]
MRVGTDGVLLGAWTGISGARKILDVGTGTGLIAIMLAQRSNAKITGVEIEKNAAREAFTNALQSPWRGRINILHASFQEFAAAAPGKFDLVVSNPPFFINDKRPADHRKSVARHHDRLSLHDLVIGADRLLTQKGRLSVVLPVFSAEILMRLAHDFNLYLIKLTEVKPEEGKSTHRYLMEFSKTKKATEKEIIAIRKSGSDGYTEEYKNITRNFYLNF